MLANPDHSHVLLINPSRNELGGVSAELAARRRESLLLLAAARQLFRIGISAVGEYHEASVPEQLSACVTVLGGNVLSLWRDESFTASLVASHIGVVFLGGAWLEEEVVITALEAVRLGYDVRVLADVSMARIDSDRALVLDRFALHGVVTMTVRQALLEWSVSLDEPSLKERVRQLLA